MGISAFMHRGRGAFLCVSLIVMQASLAWGEKTPSHPWPTTSKTFVSLATHIKPPKGYHRIKAEPGSFAHWLRSLPLKPSGSFVRLYNGSFRFNQLAHYAVIDMDVGKRDLQQCADAVMRLRAEYLYAQGRRNEIAFNFTGGSRIPFSRWSKGWRPHVKGKRVSWSRRGKRGAHYKSFRKYMDIIFAYAGTYSLEREMISVSVKDMAIGDVFIQGGFPGHAILVADMVKNPETGEKRFLLIQSFMPAQDIHVLRDPKNPLTPWYGLDFSKTLITPDWIFRAKDLRRFKN